MKNRPTELRRQVAIRPLEISGWGVGLVTVLSALALGAMIVFVNGQPVFAQAGAGQIEAESDLPQVKAGTSSTSPSQINIPPQNKLPTAKQSTVAKGERFFCQVWNGQYTVMYRPESRPQEVFPWAVPKDLKGGWFAQKRCNEISRRLEDYRPDGLQELTTSTENGYDVICATTQANPACRIVFTVPPGQDAITTRDAVFENLTVADRGTLTQGVNTFVGSTSGTVNLNDNLVNLGLSLVGGGSTWVNSAVARSAINLRPHLDPADGGTGVNMTNGIQMP
jgi:uncharacterized protein YndB with AHSA1/START domain